MQFAIIAYDGTDSEAFARRQNIRPKHIEGLKKGIAAGEHLFGGAILDDDGNMIGSIMIVDYPSKEAMESEWLNSEAYVTGGVWKDITIKPFRTVPFFLDPEAGS